MVPGSACGQAGSCHGWVDSVKSLAVRFGRCSGVLLHITSLPSRWGIGDLGPQAHRFVDFLGEAAQRVWQVLPVGPMGHGDSPYQAFSAFAGSPLLISLEGLVEWGLLSVSDLPEKSRLPADWVDFGRVTDFKMPLITQAARNFLADASAEQHRDFELFCQENRYWLDDFAFFMAIKNAQDGMVWTAWQEGIAQRRAQALQEQRQALRSEIRLVELQQYFFFRQWEALKDYCRRKGLLLMGDIPIFIAHNSADVWANPDYFALDEEGQPCSVAGVPPDYFSVTGQRWGNPLYRWDVLSDRGYEWWVERFRMNLKLFDIVRLDHFRGFEAYWEIAASEPTAVNGRWVKGPGGHFFDTLKETLGELPVVAEDLGVITPEVEALRKYCMFPGMAVLQFAFGGGRDNPFLPHNYDRNLVVYTGTHDNDTIVGWWNDASNGDSTRGDSKMDQERDFARRYLNTSGKDIHWTFITAALASVADTVIIPLQDVLGLGREARMNLPGTAEGNWRWRCTREMLTEEPCARLRELTETFNRSAVGRE